MTQSAHITCNVTVHVYSIERGGTATACCVFALRHVSSQPYATLLPQWLLVVSACQATAHHFIVSWEDD